MANPKPVPLYPTYENLEAMSLDDYPGITTLLNSGPDWWSEHYHWGSDFLRYIGKNKSENTFIRFRNEVERFLLWAWLRKDKPINEYRKADILDYIDFSYKPPSSWIGTSNQQKFILKDSYYETNPVWRPYVLKAPKSQTEKHVDKKKYRPSQQTLQATFTALIAFYKHLCDEDLSIGNPAQIAKKDCNQLVKDTTAPEVRRLTDDQWQCVLQSAIKLADRDPKYERNLFVIVTLKALFLRVSELSERDKWLPTMADFNIKGNSGWFKAFGKGRKVREVTVPSDYLPYLTRYRRSRGLSDLPLSSDKAVLVENTRSAGGLTARYIASLVQAVFDQAYLDIKVEHGKLAAKALREASTHWLRHTGASMDIERGRPLKDLSEDLGHKSQATTDAYYVQIEKGLRAKSGKTRKV